jgi:hypothetical protein
MAICMGQFNGEGAQIKMDVIIFLNTFELFGAWTLV